MEKKLTRDKALIKLLREGVEKDNRIKDLENDKKDAAIVTGKRPDSHQRQ